MPERILTERELNRALLARQMLLERSSVSIPKALERMGTLQAQYAPSMYIGLWSRLECFERDALTRALERRSVVQGTLMRATIHLVSKGDYWPIALAVREPRRRAWAAYRPDYDVRRPAAAARKLRTAFGTQSSMARKEIHELLGGDSVITGGVNMWLDLVRVPPSGTWERRRADLYAMAEDWIGPPPDSASAAAGVELLVRRYLGGYGPARAREIADFTGLPAKALGPVLDALRLRRFRAEDGSELLDLPRAPLPDPETPAPPRLLPTWDATLLAHARRTQILPEKHRSKVFGVKTPQSVPTFLVDGQVAGTWKWQKDRVALSPFGKLAKAARAALDEEAARLTELHA